MILIYLLTYKSEIDYYCIMFNTMGAIARLVFLTFLMVGNIIGFHYYFTPVASQNLKYIPANSCFVMTVNLKSISGTLFHELLFNSASFEKDVISKSEEELFGKNQSLGVNPFGLISLFRFEFNGAELNGISLNLEDNDKFIKSFQTKEVDVEKIDDITVFYNDQITAFLFNKAVVFIFSPFSKDDQEKLAAEFLLNENSFNTEFKEGHFTVFTKKGLLEKSPIGSFFRLLPDFTESAFLSGTFENDNINLNGKIKLSNDNDWKAKIDFDSPKLSKEHAMEFGFLGEGFSKSIETFLKQKFEASVDSNINSINVFQQPAEGIEISMRDFVLPIDLNVINAIMGGGLLPELEYKIQMNLYSNKIGNSHENYTFPVTLKEGNDLKRTVFAQYKKDKLESENAYFYFNPNRFVEEADINILVKSLMDPFLIFDELQLKATKFENKTLYFNGNFSLLEKDIHSLVQMRLLFKDILAIL